MFYYFVCKDANKYKYFIMNSAIMSKIAKGQGR